MTESRLKSSFLRLKTCVNPVDKEFQHYQLMKLNREDSKAFVKAVLNPPEPNNALVAAFKDYEEVFDD